MANIERHIDTVTVQLTAAGFRRATDTDCTKVRARFVRGSGDYGIVSVDVTSHLVSLGTAPIEVRFQYDPSWSGGQDDAWPPIDIATLYFPNVDTFLKSLR